MNNQSSSQAEMVQRMAENSLLGFIAQLDAQCNANGGVMPQEGVKELLASIAAVQTDQQQYENVIGPERLTPLWFELSSCLDALREHLQEALRTAEEASA